MENTERVEIKDSELDDIWWLNWFDESIDSSMLSLIIWNRLPSFYLDMPLDLDRFELDSDDNNDIDTWCDNFWDLWLQTQRVVHNVGRSLDEILRLEVELIEDNTEVDPELWIHLFALASVRLWTRTHLVQRAR